MADIVRLQQGGLVGPDNAFHIDAWGKASVNLITHAHGDHARSGSAEYWCAEDCASILRHRLGPEIRLRAFLTATKNASATPGSHFIPPAIFGDRPRFVWSMGRRYGW